MTVSVRWFPPSWLQVGTDSTCLYVDPAYLRSYYLKHPGHIEFARWPDPIDGLPEALPTADVILLTHDHKDHCKAMTIDHLSTDGTVVLGPPCCRSKAGRVVDVVEPGDHREIAGFRIGVVAAYNVADQHPGRPIAHPTGRGVGYVIECRGRRFYHAGDTDLIPEMADIRGIDVAFLPIDGAYSMPLKNAVESVRLLSPGLVVPIHWMRTDPGTFAGAVRNLGYDVVVPTIGSTVFDA